MTVWRVNHSLSENPAYFDNDYKAYLFMYDVIFSYSFGDVYEERAAKNELDESYANRESTGTFGFSFSSERELSAYAYKEEKEEIEEVC